MCDQYVISICDIKYVISKILSDIKCESRFGNPSGLTKPNQPQHMSWENINTAFTFFKVGTSRIDKVFNDEFKKGYNK